MLLNVFFHVHTTWFLNKLQCNRGFTTDRVRAPISIYSLKVFHTYTWRRVHISIHNYFETIGNENYLRRCLTERLDNTKGGNQNEEGQIM